MATSLETVYRSALDLGEEDRAELVDRLLASVPSENPEPLHPVWPTELARRAAQLDSGQVKTIPWSEVKRRARAVLSHDRCGALPLLVSGK